MTSLSLRNYYKDEVNNDANSNNDADNDIINKQKSQQQVTLLGISQN